MIIPPRFPFLNDLVIYLEEKETESLRFKSISDITCINRYFYHTSQNFILSNIWWMEIGDSTRHTHSCGYGDSCTHALKIKLLALIVIAVHIPTHLIIYKHLEYSTYTKAFYTLYCIFSCDAVTWNDLFHLMPVFFLCHWFLHATWDNPISSSFKVKDQRWSGFWFWKDLPEELQVEKSPHPAHSYVHYLTLS